MLHAPSHAKRLEAKVTGEHGSRENVLAEMTYRVLAEPLHNSDCYALGSFRRGWEIRTAVSREYEEGQSPLNYTDSVHQSIGHLS